MSNENTVPSLEDLSNNIINESSNTNTSSENIVFDTTNTINPPAVSENNSLPYKDLLDPIPISSNYQVSKEFIIFKNELESLNYNNLCVLKECKNNKRLLDIKYSDLNKKINYIQISVIVFSTLSGFLQSTKEYFNTSVPIVSVTGISISTYISLILSVSKYFKFDEKKEAIHNLREKYGNLHNKIEYRMDILGPFNNFKLWQERDPVEKMNEWNSVKHKLDEEYLSLVETKQALTTEFESIMDSKSRNKNYIKDKELVLYNRKQLVNTLKKHKNLETSIITQNIPTNFESSIMLPDDDLNNWDDPV